jgi:hypothetical protein
MEKHPPPIEAMPDITTPVIDLQELEHKPGELPEVDLAKEERKMRRAIQEFEESIKDLPPG